MTTTQDLYIDSESTGSYNNFDIHLPHPVIVDDDEKAYICLKDFQMLNSCYNISSDLQNNTYTILHTTRSYTRTPLGTFTDYFTDTNLFQTTGVNIYKPVLNSVNDGTAHTETLIPNAGGYTIKLYDSTITTTSSVIPANSKFMNIFNAGTSTAYMTFNPTDYLVYYNTASLTESRFVASLEVILENIVLNIILVPSTAVYIAIEVWGSVDGITWTALSLIGSNVMTFATNEWGTIIQKSIIVYFSTVGAYQYHKVSFLPTGAFTTTLTLKNAVKFKRILLLRYSSYTETIADSNYTYNKTIEDGFYSLANLNASLNNSLSTHISGNLTFSNYISGKPFLTAQNKQVLAWSSSQPYYYYKETDKIDESYRVEIQFNSTLRKMLGWITSTSTGNIILLRTNDNITAPTYLNLINFKKILMTSSLKLTTKPYTFLNKNYTKATGLGDVFAWIAKDIAPFSYINWTNATDYKIEIDDKLITKINFKMLNEFAQVMNDMPACNFHLQIIKIKNNIS